MTLSYINYYWLIYLNLATQISKYIYYHNILHQVILNTGFALNQIHVSKITVMVLITCFCIYPPQLILNDFLALEQSFDRGAENQVTSPQGKAL